MAHHPLSPGRACELAPAALRLDLFLKYARLIPRRTLAQEACARGSIRINGRAAKPAHLVQSGDILHWQQKSRTLQYRVLRIPAAPPAKKEAASLVEFIGAEGEPAYPHEESGSEL